MSFNQPVNTPLGRGVTQGAFMATGGQNELVAHGIIVRLAINDVTKPTMNQSNCLTPHATLSGLWVFGQGDVQ